MFSREVATKIDVCSTPSVGGIPYICHRCHVSVNFSAGVKLSFYCVNHTDLTTFVTDATSL